MIATPMQNGIAEQPAAPAMPPAIPARIPCLPDSQTASGMPTPAIADPVSSHFSCCRRSPDERR